MDHVNYNALDTAKSAFIQASKKTLSFAEQYGFIPDGRLGASANVFSLNLKPYLEAGAENLFITLLPEGLGTADDARPDDLTEDEQVAFWHNIGRKMLSVTTNDAASSGMQTILLSLYLPCADPELVFNPAFMKGFLNGFVEACKEVGCVYFSGETPQLKNKIVADKIDLAGALFGLMPPGLGPVDGSRLKAGDKMVFIESTGPNENGFTSLRELASKLSEGYRTKLPSGIEYYQAINNRSHLYTPLIQDLLKANIYPTNIEPITGHGWQKIMRSSKPLRYIIEETLDIPEVFQFVQEQSESSPKEMVQIFNYGLGLVIFVETEEEVQQVLEKASAHQMKACKGGRVEAAEKREVIIESFNCSLKSDSFLLEQ